MESFEAKQQILRSPSAASDITVRSTSLSVPHATLPPAYVGRDAAAELITSEIERKVVVSNSALGLLNEFLDQVLYSILLSSRSTTLSSLKAAISVVLKPRLGRSALRVAEEELQEYLTNEEEQELHTRAVVAERKHDFDADLAWRLARLRCMVYTRLGDLEEEDEEEWLEKDGLLMQLRSARSTSQTSIETGPASAIFLTSIIEFLAEQALYYAAQHGQRRHSQQGNHFVYDDEPDIRDLLEEEDDFVVCGKDMNQVGRDSPLSRLWRSYRHNNRETSSVPASPEVRAPRGLGLGLSHSRGPSSVQQEAVIFEERSPDQIPLPSSGNDVDQIEIPGLAPGFSDDEEEDEEDEAPVKKRPASMIDRLGISFGAMEAGHPDPPEIPQRSPLRPMWLRNRSISTPVPTLAKLGTTPRGSALRLVDTGPEDDQDSMSQVRVLVDPRRPSLHRDHYSTESAEASFGGAVAAVAGALDVGTLGLPMDNEVDSKPVENIYQANANTIRLAEALGPKRTVAEEMLGTTARLQQTEGVTIGASITDMSDFQSMHVPIAVSPTSSIGPSSPVTPIASKRAYFSASSGTHNDLTPRAEQPNPMVSSGVSTSLAEHLQPAPLQPTNVREPTSRPGTSGSSKKPILGSPFIANNSQVRDLDTTTPAYVAARTGGPPAETVVSNSIYELPPESSQVQYTKSDPYISNGVPHTRQSSTASRLIGVTKGHDERNPVLEKPENIVVNEDFHRTNSPSAVNIARDLRPGTGGSSVSKRFHGKPLQFTEDSDEAKKKSLEILIRGNETLHYTLTPAAAMRDDVSSISTKATSRTNRFVQPLVPSRNRTPNQELAEFLRNTGPREDNMGRYKASSHIQTQPEQPASPSDTVQQGASASSSQGVVNPASPGRSKNPFGEPRDPRTERKSSTKDLADYARSTGPLDSKQLPQSLGAEAAKSTSPRVGMASPHLNNARKDLASSANNNAANRLRYQARDARPSRVDDTSGLIDFIREGPPREGREHRIDRKVAPFRTTMDSDDFDNLTQGRGIATSLRDSEDGRNVSSVDPSVSSQTPLIISNGRTPKAAMTSVPARQRADSPEGMPKKTRRRIKDPYAIYDSDDDDLDDDLGAKDVRSQEESLIDFLRNTAPPPGMTASPILASPPTSFITDHLQASGARASSPHLTQSGSKMDKYRPTQPTHAAHIDRNTATHTAPPAPSTVTRRTSTKPKLEARDAKVARTDMSELADYLKNSGPSPTNQYQPQPFVRSTPAPEQPVTEQAPRKEEKGLFKRFSKLKK